MRRSIAAAGYVGIALICLSLIEFQRWPYFLRQIHRGDFTPNYEAWRPELADWLGITPGNPLQVSHVVYFVLLNAAALALIGLVLGATERKQLGATLFIGGAVSGSLVIALVALSIDPPTCRPFFLTVEAFGAFVAVLIVCWLTLQPRGAAGVPLAAMLFAACSLAMIALTIWYAGSTENVCQTREDVVLAPKWPFVPFLAFLAAGLLSSFTQPPSSCGPTAFLLVLLAGVALAIPALAIAHDEPIEVHEGFVGLSDDVVTVRTNSCPPPDWAPVVKVDAIEVGLSGSIMGRAGDASELEKELFASLVELKKANDDLEAQELTRAGGRPVELRRGGDLSIYADASMSLSTFGAIGRAAFRSGHTRLQIISLADRPIAVWTQPMTHQHLCALQIELGDDGQPLSEFVDWPSLVRRADQASGKLRVRMP